RGHMITYGGVMDAGPGVDRLLARARVGLRRLEPPEAAEAVRRGAVLVDTRPASQRQTDGEIPGALLIERNHLEWRLDPSSGASIPEAIDRGVAWIIICDEGYSSSLAAASLKDLGLPNVADVIGGFQ